MTIQMSTEFYISKKEGTREFHHFAPEGFLEEIWVSFEGDEAGQELCDEVCETLFAAVFEDGKDHEAVERFEESLKHINEKLLEEAVLPDDFLQKNSFFIGLLQGKNLHFTTIGNTEVYLIRAGKVMCISEGIAPKGPEDDLFVNIATGELQNEDTVLFSSFRMLRLVTMGQISEITKNSPKEAVDTFKDFISDAEGGIYAVLKASGAPTLPFDTVPAFPRLSMKGFGVFDKIFSRASHFFYKISGNPKKEVLAVIIGGITLLLVWSFFSFLSGNVQNGDPKVMNDLIVKMESDLATAEAQKEAGKGVEALAILGEVEKEANGIFDSGNYRSKASEILSKVEEIRDGISNTQRISGDTAKVNLAAKQANVSALGVFQFENELYAYSRDTLFRILLQDIESSVELLASETVIKGIPFEKIGKIIFLTESGKILEWKSGSAPAFSKTQDEGSWKRAVDIATYGTALYLLSPAENQIWKYNWQTDRYSKPSAYNQDAAVQEGISMTVDGNIFILTKSGNVVRLLRGKNSPFALKNMPPEFHDLTQIFTLPDSDLLLFLSPAQKRVFLFTKTDESATFFRQFVLDGDNIGNLSGLWLNIDSNTIYVTDEKRIHEISIPKQ
ncbi:MAG: hypothetical protein WCJ84_01835 [Candidatus Peregrinibacteria bacterium]